MQTFTIHDLRDHTGELMCDAEAGRLSLITKHGQLGYPMIRTAGLLVLANRKGLLERVQPCLATLGESGYFLGKDVNATVLRLAGESPP